MTTALRSRAATARLTAAVTACLAAMGAACGGGAQSLGEAMGAASVFAKEALASPPKGGSDKSLGVTSPPWSFHRVKGVALWEEGDQRFAYVTIVLRDARSNAYASKCARLRLDASGWRVVEVSDGSCWGRPTP